MPANKRTSLFSYFDNDYSEIYGFALRCMQCVERSLLTKVKISSTSNVKMLRGLHDKQQPHEMFVSLPYFVPNNEAQFSYRTLLEYRTYLKLDKYRVWNEERDSRKHQVQTFFSTKNL